VEREKEKEQTAEGHIIEQIVEEGGNLIVINPDKTNKYKRR
jgi:hypothetical protein